MNRLKVLLIIATICCLTGFKNPPGAARFMELGAKAHSEGRPSEALDFYSRGISLAPEKADYYLTRAFLLLKLNCREDALLDFNRYIEREPDSIQGYMGRGMLNSDLGRQEEARADFLKACELGDQGGCSFATEGKR